MKQIFAEKLTKEAFAMIFCIRTDTLCAENCIAFTRTGFWTG